MKTGTFKNYHWLVSREEINNIDKIVINFHQHYILHLATFDSGPLAPNEKESNQGWTFDCEIMFSPELNGKVIIPYEQYDEWYLSKTKLTFPKGFDCFVNYSGFNLTSESDFNPKFQTQFWEQLIKINPETLVAIGDNDIVVSKNASLINYINESA